MNSFYKWIRKINFLSKPILITYIVLLVISITYYTSISLHLIPSILPTSKFQLLFLAIIESFFVLIILKTFTSPVMKYHKEKAWRSVFAVSLTNFLMLIYLFNYYGMTTRAEIVTVSKLLQVVPYLFIVLLAAMLISFWYGFQKVITEILSKIEFTSQNKESRKEKWIIAIIVGVSIIVGAFFRFTNLNFPPYVDEYPLTHAAIQLLNGIKPAYTRALYLVALPVSISFKIFGTSIWAARFVMALINMLGMIPLFFLGKRIHKYVGPISILLYATNPWIISIAKNIREYAIIPVFFFTTALLLLDMLEIEKQTLKQYFLRHKWRILFLLLLIAYSIFDNYSIIKVNFINFAIFGILLVYKLWRNISKPRIKFFLFGSGMLFILAVSYYFGIFKNFKNLFIININPQYLASLVNSTTRQWYFLFPVVGYLILTVTIIVVIFCLVRLTTKQEVSLTYISLFFWILLAYLTFVLYKGVITEMVRYGALLQYWYVLVVAIFFGVILCFLDRFIKHKVLEGVIIALVFLGFFVNYPSFEKTLNFKDGRSEITGEYHYNVEPAYQHLLPLIAPDEVILTTFFVDYDELNYNKFKDNQIILYSKQNIEQSTPLISLLGKNKKGWIVLPRYFIQYIPTSNFVLGSYNLNYLGAYGDLLIWHWNKFNK